MRKLKERRFVFLLNRTNRLKKRVAVLESLALENIKAKEILTVEETLELFKMSRSTFDRLRKKGFKVSQPNRNGKIYVNRAELEKFLQKK
ncbi:DNA-binding protein [Chryseobacterium shandongense]|uniref:DNA-binding protein n=1 Tax=Chryseobacterium shandongense TaxID=1493872 RepID=A0AAD0YEA6_9FLAO|nr:helix-turn-helix domain-containing protein [Chryseobacterium shandongense]AZA86833.1 DNA-binding protein [Chryseobacterium shandongense]AZA95249.1 DNA-binding protein [Chryseobacterium shandongense]